ncbi:outer membrane beta-barrel protein [Alistipes sp.]|uniref:outer membrane beta-barrel protein n=1 Tax=Alistipes sp. TaxID=1872444 RepID=UPI003AEF95CC
MKKSTYIRTIALAAAVLAFVRPAQAQLFPNSYINIDWQVNVPLGGDFAQKASGWGMNFEGGYFVTPEIAVGPFISYQTNLESISRRTLDLGSGSALTTNQKHATFQLPFGVTGRYNWLKDSIFQPYAGLKLGACWAEFSSYYYVVKQYTDTWGFYLSPEVGVSIFPRPDYRLGFHVALYYSYATNSGDVLTYSVNNLNNFGIRVGVSF